jgi:probable phosphoglycerate mutase
MINRGTRLYFIRHAEAEGNVKRIFHGHTDSDLTEKGHIQAQMLARNIKDLPVDKIYSSDLTRTMKTASYISKIKGLDIEIDRNLREINGGQWENMSWNELPLKWPEEYYLWENKPHLHTMPGGETMKEFYVRLSSCIDNITRDNPGKNLCIVTHGAAIRALTCYIKYCDLKYLNSIVWVDNTSITEALFCEGNYTLINQGITSHLDSDLKTIENQDWWIEKRRLFNE